MAARLSGSAPASREKLSEESGLSVKPVGNVIHALIMFGIARGKPAAAFLDARMESNGELDVLKRVRLVFKRHSLYRQLSRLDEGSVIRVEDLVAALKEANPTARHRPSTWEIYAERLGPWLVASGLMQVRGNGWILQDFGHPVVPSRRGNRFRVGGFYGQAPPLRVVRALLWLTEMERTTSERVKSEGYRNAMSVLERLELTDRDDVGSYVPIHTVRDERDAERFVWEAASKDETLGAVWDFLLEHPTATGVDIGAFLSDWEGQQRSRASQMRIGNAVRVWAMWIGRGHDAVGVPRAPGARVRKEGTSDGAPLFDEIN